MKCQDVRRTLALFLAGQLALTEWAIIQGHLLECAECRKERDRLLGLAGLRARGHQRRATAMTAVATAVVLAVAAVGGVFIYRGSVPDFSLWGTPGPPRTVAPPAPGLSELVVVPAPVERPAAPPAARSKGTAEVTPWGTAPPAPGPAAPSPHPAANAEAPGEERMPTSQARPSAALPAPPGAEAMPTQGLPRSRP